MGESSLKTLTARTVKWNAIDRLSSQILYAVVGVVLANIISKEDFGMVGVLLIFQAFAIIFVDSGFGAALIQKKECTQADYSTVFWFNLAVSTVIYIILFASSPLIASLFHSTEELIPLSRMMFLTFILNGLGIVQTNRLMKQMKVRMIAISNIVGLVISGIAGVVMALKGFGAWALVWQSVLLAAVKTSILWATGGWRPSFFFSRESFRGIWRVGMGVFSSSMLNTLCLYLYNFVIGFFFRLSELGVYTQADKWSKMGSASTSQILTASFLPLLSKVQSDRETFLRYITRINRFAAFISFPFLLGLAVMGEPIFNLLFGNKWDDAVPLFQLLCVRGIFIVMISLYSNYLLSLGYGRRMFRLEIVKDLLLVAAIFATIWPHNVEILVWGQLMSSVVTFIVAVIYTAVSIGYRIKKMFLDLLPFLLATAVACVSVLLLQQIVPDSFQVNLRGALRMAVSVTGGLAVYLIISGLFRFPELKEGISFITGKLKRE